MRFENVEELQSFLESLDAHYGGYAEELWCCGVRRLDELANAHIEDLEAAGVARFQARNIKAKAGEAALDRFQH